MSKYSFILVFLITLGALSLIMTDTRQKGSLSSSPYKLVIIDCNDIPIIYEPVENDSLYYQVRYNDKYYYVTESHNKVIQYLIPYPNR